MKLFQKSSQRKYSQLSPDTAVSLKDCIQRYIHSLNMLKVQTPEQFKIVVKNNSQSFFVETNETLYSQLLIKTLTHENSSQCAGLLRAYVEEIFKILEQKKIHTSIDPKVENFAYKSKNKLIYFDFLPPLMNSSKSEQFLRRTDEQTQEIAWKKQRYYSHNGLLLTALVRLGISVPQHWEFTARLLLSKVKDHRKDLQTLECVRILESHLNRKNENELLTEALKIRVIGASSDDRDLLRLLFFLLNHNTLNPSQVTLNEYFRLSKSPKTFPEARNIVLSYFL